MINSRLDVVWQATIETGMADVWRVRKHSFGVVLERHNLNTNESSFTFHMDEAEARHLAAIINQALTL